MPFQSNSGGGGPWGGGGNRGGGRNPWGGNGGGPRGPGGGQQGPDLDELIRKGRDQLRVVLGGRGGGPRGPGGGRRGPGGRQVLEGYLPYVLGLILLVFWIFQSVYSVKPEERSVELWLGEFSEIGDPGLNFALWPLTTYEILPVTTERFIDIGTGSGGRRSDQGLMLTGDENIVDIDFQVVWNIADPAQFLFNLAEPEATVRAVSESAMREVISRSRLKPILSRDRAVISQEVEEVIQQTLDSYDSGVNVVRVNFDGADPPSEVIDAFRDVQAAEQDRDTLEKRAEAYANQKLAGARGQAAQIMQEAEGYSARVVNEAKGEAARFEAIYEEYALAPLVTRKRLYLETLERVFGDVEKIIIDQNLGGSAGGGSGVVPYLPLTELRRRSSSNSSPTAGESN